MRRSQGDGRWAEGAVRAIMAEASRHALLSREEEVALAREGSPAARKRLVLANLRLALAAARKMARDPTLSVADVLHDAVEGLCVAAERFDPERGVRFATFAGWWILAKALRGLRSRRILASGSPRTLRDAPAWHLELHDELVESTPSLGASPHDAVEAEEVRASVRRVALEAARNPVERLVLRERILSDAPKTLGEVGAMHGTSREWIRQVEERLRLRIERALKRAAEEEGEKRGAPSDIRGGPTDEG